jgi:hypothetical protein
MNNVSQMSADLPTPKRGMFPTPKEEIERAKPYIPESDQRGDKPPINPASPSSPEKKKDDKSTPTKNPGPG